MTTTTPSPRPDLSEHRKAHERDECWCPCLREAAPLGGLREALERLAREGLMPWEEYTPPVYIPPANMRLRKSYLDALMEARALLDALDEPEEGA